MKTSQMTPQKKKVLEKEIHEFFTMSLAFIRSKNVEGLVHRFIPNGKVKKPGHPLISGYKQLGEAYKTQVNLKDLHETADHIIIALSEEGDMASVLSDYTVSFTTNEGAQFDRGNRLLYLTRVKDEWKIAIEMLSSSLK